MNQKDLLEKIAEDLNISRFKEEDDIGYRSRVIYTAVGQWIQTSILDQNVLRSDLTETCRTPQYITQKCRKILNAYSVLYPEINDWFHTDKNSNPIRLMYKRYTQAGVLVSSPGNTYQISNTIYGKITSDLYYVQGIPDQNVEKIEHYGLGTFVRSVPDDAKIIPIENMFNLPKMTAYTYAKELVESVIPMMTKSTVTPSGREYFDVFIKKSLSSSWTPHFNPKWYATVYRNNKYDDYGLVVNDGGELMTWKLPDYMTKSYETKRVMFGLRSKGLQSIGQQQEGYSLEEDKGTVKISLNSTMPKAEEALFYQIAWPVRSIKDGGEFITSTKFLPLIKTILHKKLSLNAWS